MNIEYFSLPLDRPLTTARGEITERTGYLVHVEDSSPGIGEATPLDGWTESFNDCESALRNFALHASTPGASGEIGGPFPEQGDSLYNLDGLPPAARHGVVLAWHDAQARTAGLPLYRYLGGPEQVETVPANATVGDGDPHETVSEVERAVKSEFPAVKIKVGARSVEADVDRISAVREACPEINLRLDANGSWSVEEANKAFEQLGAFNVDYVEQPLPAEDLEKHSDLRGRGIGIALDEGLYEHGLDAVLTASVADVLILKPMVMGGPDIAIETAVIARGAGIEPVVTTTIDGAFARAAAVHVAAAIPDVLPCGLATGHLLRSDLISDPVPVHDGHVAVPQKEGNTPATSTTDNA